MTLVSGASGFIGGHVARLLSARGERLRLLLRPDSDRRGLEGLGYEEACGDLRDRPSLERALEGCRMLYHVAADYRLWARDPNEIRRSNVEGTRNILEAAAEAGVERVVYTSTVGTIGMPGDEETPVGRVRGVYKSSKLEAERIALEMNGRGLPVVVVNPTAPVGELDLKPTPTGKIVVDFVRGAMPAYVDTGLNVADVRDVALGHLLAGERGVAGERYILGARNMSLREILETLAGLTGRRAPRVRLPHAVAYAFGALETGWAELTGRPPRAPLEAVRMARSKMYVSSAKAERELGYRPGPVEPALERAIAWFRENRYC